jgi:hypothetical protein
VAETELDNRYSRMSNKFVRCTWPRENEYFKGNKWPLLREFFIYPPLHISTPKLNETCQKNDNLRL